MSVPARRNAVARRLPLIADVRPPGNRLLTFLASAVALASAGGCGTEPLDPNRPPVLFEAIPDMEMLAGRRATVDLGSHFKDPERAALSYRVETSNPSVVGFAVAGGGVTLEALRVGSGTVRVTATDPAGLAATADFAVSVDLDARLCERTPQIRDAILRAAGAADCTRAGASAVAQVRVLNFGGAPGGYPHPAITTLKEGDFAGLSRLDTLILANNDIAFLPDGVFSELSGLEVLNLGGNRLASVSAGALSGLGGLKVLGIGGNELSSLPPGVFAGLPELERLFLDGNRLTAVEQEWFSGLSGLDLLSLRDNGLKNLADGVFAELPNLTELDLTNNRLTSVSPGWFRGLSKLTVLALRGNELSSLVVGAFSEMSALEHLHLGGNRLESVEPRWFRGLSELQSLRLNGNGLATLPEGAFAEMSGLQWLILAKNQLSELPGGVFAGLDSLRTLQLGSNRLSSLPDGLFSGLESLGWVDMRGNPGSPLELALEWDVVGDVTGTSASVRLLLGPGAPFHIAVRLLVQNGSVRPSYISLEPGDTEGTVSRVTRAAGGGATRLRVEALPEVPQRGIVMLGLGLVGPEELVLSGS